MDVTGPGDGVYGPTWDHPDAGIEFNIDWKELYRADCTEVRPLRAQLEECEDELPSYRVPTEREMRGL